MAWPPTTHQDVQDAVTVLQTGLSARAIRTTSQAISATTPTLIGLDTMAVNDSTSYYTFASNVITAVTAGFYVVSFYADVTTTGAFSLYVVKNSNTTLQESGGPSGYRVAATTFVRLSAGETLGLWIYGTTTCTVNGTTNSKDVGLAAVYLGT